MCFVLGMRREGDKLEPCRRKTYRVGVCICPKPFGGCLGDRVTNLAIYRFLMVIVDRYYFSDGDRLDLEVDWAERR
ncbi:MAG TPA: hypothetical protein DD438_13735 [Verrucomicrobiales bacterium]|nr:hypothetical protein [Verrucomicrobiales bacterium]HCQ38229.1 hypothetical protein [Verrucomicrobiales bacterium]